MLPLLAAAAATQAPRFADAVPWAINFAAPGDFCMVGDVDGDGYADLIRVSPKGDSFIDVAINVQGMKCRVPQRAVSNWGKDCQAACCGQLDESPGVGVVGLFEGDTLRLAHAFKDGTFKDEPGWLKLPRKLAAPHLRIVRSNSGQIELQAWSERTGDGYLILPKDRSVGVRKAPKGATWMSGGFWMDGSHRIFEESNHRLMGSMKSGNPLAFSYGDVGAADLFLDEEELSSEVNEVRLPSSQYPDSPSVWESGDVDHDGYQDLVQFRFGNEAHSGHNVLLYRRIPSTIGRSNASGSASPSAVAPNMDSSGDGLLDDWKINGFRGLDLKSLGCLPGQRDLVCFISRYANADKKMVDDTFTKIEAYYLTFGWHLHPIFLDPVNEEDQKKPWWQLRDKFLPAKWRGVAHWMAVTPYGGGQADELSDGGVCGGNNWTLYATFIHEFGHQLGLNHEGFYQATGCPIYSSLMNYPYSYTFENDIKKIHYSDGALANYVLDERNLDETIPLPFEKVKFLADAPYHFRLKANGATTLIDWNWDGVFGEKHVRADINYAYSTTAGRRDNAGKTQCAPWTFTHGRDAFVLFAQNAVKPDGKSDPSVGPDKPGWLMLQRLVKPFEWAKPIKIAEEGVTGDPCGISFKGEIVAAYPSSKGLEVRWIRTDKDKLSGNDLKVIDDSDSVPSFATYRGNLFLFEWSPKEGSIRYRVATRGHEFSPATVLMSSGSYPSILKSTVAVSAVADTMHDRLILALAENQDANRPSRWEIRRYLLKGGQLAPDADPKAPTSEREWVEGEKGGARGGARLVALFDEKGLTGMKGRILLFGGGSRNGQPAWTCEYVAQSIGDKTVNGGWMVKRYYDEWTQSRSGPAACWFGGDILYAYRWVDGSQGDGDNILHVGYNGTGIEDKPMGDFDDVGFIRDFGMRHSILYLHE